MAIEKHVPNGTGVWLWQLRRCDGGDTRRMVARLTSAGVTWVMLKVGDTERGWPAQPLVHGWETCAKALRSAGIAVYAWAYVSTFAAAAEARMVTDALATGLVDGFMFDPEGEEEQDGGHGAQVHEMLARVRAKEPDAWLGFAPYPQPSTHAKYPWREFMSVCDAVHPQAYWPALGVPPEWACEQVAIEFGDLYERWPETRSCALSAAGTMHHCAPDEIRRFLAQPVAAHAPSLWTYEYADDAQWAALGAHARGEIVPAAPRIVTVHDVQTALGALGYACGAVDGRMGPRTRAAIGTFQKARGLAPGPIGPRTLAALRDATG